VVCEGSKADLSVAGRWLAAKKYTSVWGVGRHILGSQIFDYWWDTSGFMIEVSHTFLFSDRLGFFSLSSLPLQTYLRLRSTFANNPQTSSTSTHGQNRRANGAEQHYTDGDRVNKDTPIGRGPAGNESLAVWGPEVPAAFLN